ncbi:hypothetical protein [Streptomyces sp. NPDC020951]|uniref:hypothetical protein n=1 Tax=Streptomyces sp. NPDC020951 TaxID=3365104 RepID=UPI00378F1C1D
MRILRRRERLLVRLLIRLLRVLLRGCVGRLRLLGLTVGRLLRRVLGRRLARRELRWLRRRLVTRLLRLLWIRRLGRRSCLVGRLRVRRLLRRRRGRVGLLRLAGWGRLLVGIAWAAVSVRILGPARVNGMGHMGSP